MTVLYVCADPGIPVFGTKGASVHVQEVISVLLHAGHRVELFCRRTGGEPWPALASARDRDRLVVHHLPAPKTAGLAERERALLEADADLRDAVRNRIGDLRGSRDAVGCVYERYSLWSRAGIDAAAATGLPSVLEVNAPLPEEQARHRGLVHEARAREIAAHVIGTATAVVCVSAPVARWCDQVSGGRTERVIVAPNGVDIDRIAPVGSSAHTRETGPVTIGFVGTLKPWHGTETLLEAFARARAHLHDLRLLIVGDGPEAPALHALAERLDITDAVEFTGAVGPQEVPSLLRRMDVGVAPYPREDDGLPMYFSPLKVYEYLAAGLAVVASAVGELPTVVEHDVTGLLVPGSDAVALGGALGRLGSDAGLRDRLGAAARQRAIAHHTWRRVVGRSLAAAGVELHPRAEAA